MGAPAGWPRGCFASRTRRRPRAQEVRVPPLAADVHRVAALSVHSSPLAPPGVGDSGGMNVTIRALAGELARAGIASDLYTRAASPDLPPVVEVEPGVRVLHLPAGPPEPVPKQSLPRYLCAFLCSLLRAGERYGPYDVLHSHYWV